MPLLWLPLLWLPSLLLPLHVMPWVLLPLLTVLVSPLLPLLTVSACLPAASRQAHLPLPIQPLLLLLLLLLPKLLLLLLKLQPLLPKLLLLNNVIRLGKLVLILQLFDPPPRRLHCCLPLLLRYPVGFALLIPCSVVPPIVLR